MSLTHGSVVAVVGRYSDDLPSSSRLFVSTRHFAQSGHMAVGYFLRRVRCLDV